MKKLTLLLSLICSIGFAQKQEALRIDSLPKQGILLDKNWKWHAGDSPDFAKKGMVGRLR
jgi:two-component system, NtrC family, sensor kinase